MFVRQAEIHFVDVHLDWRHFALESLTIRIENLQRFICCHVVDVVVGAPEAVDFVAGGALGKNDQGNLVAGRKKREKRFKKRAVLFKTKMHR